MITGNQERPDQNQIIAAWSISKFREILSIIGSKYSVSISQMSDCAFIWSENVSDVILASSDFMWKATLTGLLCRAGLSYGEVLIPENDNNNYGTFILGEAVTRAVNLEKTGKGCRIFTDSDTIGQIYNVFPKGNNHNWHKIYQASFSEIRNNLDYSIHDEFKWYLFHGHL